MIGRLNLYRNFVMNIKYLILLMICPLFLNGGCAVIKPGNPVRDLGVDLHEMTAEASYIIEKAESGRKLIVIQPDLWIEDGWEVIGRLPEKTILAKRHLIYAGTIMGDTFIYNLKDLGMVMDYRVVFKADVPHSSLSGVVPSTIVIWDEMDTETYLKQSGASDY